MSIAFKRSLISSLIVCGFSLGSSVAIAADTASSPSSDANAATSTTGSQPSGSTATTTTGTGTAATTTGSTTPGSTGGNAADATSPSTAQAPSGAASEDNPARRVFDQLDSNHDGMLSFEEFSRATIQRQQ